MEEVRLEMLTAPDSGTLTKETASEMMIKTLSDRGTVYCSLVETGKSFLIGQCSQ